MYSLIRLKAVVKQYVLTLGEGTVYEYDLCEHDMYIWHVHVMCVCMTCMRVCVCVCVCERERERT